MKAPQFSYGPVRAKNLHVANEFLQDIVTEPETPNPAQWLLLGYDLGLPLNSTMKLTRTFIPPVREALNKK